MIVNAKTFKPIGRWGKEEKQEYAKMISEREVSSVLRNSNAVKILKNKFEEHVHSERVRLGLV